jgi:hypothetical protein
MGTRFKEDAFPCNMNYAYFIIGLYEPCNIAASQKKLMVFYCSLLVDIIGIPSHFKDKANLMGSILHIISDQTTTP